MKFKWYILPLIISISTTIIFYSKEYYLFKENIKKLDLSTLETFKTLEKLLVFTASNVKKDTRDKEIQELLSIHFGYNLIFDDDLILHKSRIFTLKTGKITNSLGTQSKINNQLIFAETLSKKHPMKIILFADISSVDNSIYLLYTAQNSSNTFLLHFPLDASFFKIQHLKKMGLNAFDLPSLPETNKFLAETFVTDNAIFYNNLNFWKIPPRKYSDIIIIFLIQFLFILIYLLFAKLTNLKKRRLLSKLFTILNISVEEKIIDKIAEYQSDILKLNATLKKTKEANLTFKSIAEINKKSLLMERQINKEIAKNLDQDLHKITQLAGDTAKSFTSGISISNQMIINMLTTIKDSTARLLFLRTGQFINTNHETNIKDCIKKTLTLFAPQLQEIECKVDLDQLPPDLIYRCPETTLIQVFNGIFERLLFSMEQANDNFIKVTPKHINNGFYLVLENSSLGIHPTVADTTELVSSCLSVPNWISTKAIARTINISIEESFILGKGDILTMIFDGILLMKQGSKNENLCSIPQ